MSKPRHPFGIFVSVMAIVSFAIIGGILFIDWKFSDWWQLAFGLVVSAFAVFSAVFYSRTYYDLRSWSAKNQMIYKPTGQYHAIWERMNANKGKSFLQAREILYKDPPPLTSVWGRLNSQDEKKFFNDGPMSYGEIRGRQVWVYRMSGMMHVTAKPIQGFFHGWCMEIQTNATPVSVSAIRRFLGHHDTLDTESISFEKMYDLNVPRVGSVLQLLDPVMMELIIQSGISAIEFSDSSIVLIHTIFPPQHEDLDRFLEFGMKIAGQVERNFPLGKYEHNQ